MQEFDLRAPAASVVVVQAQLGDRAALDTLLRALQSPLYAHIAQMVRDDDLARDVLQESLWVVCRKIGSLRDPRWLRAWAYRIATRESVRHLRRARGRVDRTADDDVELLRVAAPQDEPHYEPELVQRLPALLAALPPACQAVVRMRYIDELGVGEIAEALEIPEGTVKSRLAYGLTRLREAVVLSHR